MTGSAVIGSLRVNLGIDTAAFSDGLKQAGTKMSGFAAGFRKAIVPIAAVATAAGAGVAMAVRGTIKAADEMHQAAQKFGIPIETLSRLKYAAGLADVSMETLGASVGRLNINMAKAAKGNKAAVEAFEGIGVAFADAEGNLRPTEAVLADIADVVASMPDGAAKSSLGVALMGKSWKELIPLLNDGAVALRETMAEADTFGQVFTAEMGANADAFRDNIDRLQGVFGSASADLAERLLPHLADLSEWAVRHGPTIADALGDAIEGTAGAIDKIATALAAARAAVQDAKSGVRDFTLGVTEMSAVVSQSVADVRASFLGMVDSVRNFIVETEAALVAMRERFVQVGRDLIAGLWQGMKERWAELIAQAQGLASDLVGQFKGWLGIQSPSTVFAEIGRDIMAGLGLGLSEGEPGVRAQLTGIAGDLPTLFGEVGEVAGRHFRSFVDSIVDGSAKAGDALRALAKDLTRMLLNKAITQIVSGIFTGLGGGFGGGLGIPGFARGTNFAPGGLAMVGEHGAELVHLPRGSRVIPNHKLGGGDVTVIVNNAPAGTTVQESRGADGRRIIEIAIKEGMKTAFARGEMDSTMRRCYGLNRQQY